LNPEILAGSQAAGVKQRWGGETSYFLDLCFDILKTRKPCYRRKKTTRCYCKFWYVSNFTISW